MKDLIIIGAATAFDEIAGIVQEINKREPRYRITGILDDNAKLHGEEREGVKVLGGLDRAIDFQDKCRFVFGIGSMQTRLNREDILRRTRLSDDSFESLIHPHTSIDKSASIGPGCIIHHGVAIGNHANLEGFNIVAVNSALGPNTFLYRHAMITTLCVILSNSQIGRNTFIGSGSCITENLNIEKGCFVGVGSVVTRSLAKGSYGMGNPFRVLKVEDVSSI